MPTQFHAVLRSAEKLKAAGFHEIREVDQWNLEAGKGYYMTRNLSSLIAFRVPKTLPAAGGAHCFKIVTTHGDSPCLRLAPRSKMEDRYGFQQFCVQVYGGPILHSWLDRDLCLAGKVVIK